MGNETKNLDDIISSNGGAPIIVQDSGGDKKILYILLIALVILFILAIGLIAFLGGKYYSNDSESGTVAKSAIETPVKKAPVVQKVATQEKTPKATKSEVSDLEKMVQEEESKQPAIQKPKKTEVAAEPEKKVAPAQQQAIQKAASAATGKALSQEDLAKIAALVAQELAKSKVVTAKKSVAATQGKTGGTASNDAALAAQLESVETDTLQNEKVPTKPLKGNVKAGSNKKVDTFNKVIVKQKGSGDDELSKLSAEIDSILQSEDVSQNKEVTQYKQELSKESAQREKEMRFIVVKKGDTLSDIANRAYGRASAYIKIYSANPDIVRNPNRIYVGMRLRVPVDEEYKKQQGK